MSTRDKLFTMLDTLTDEQLEGLYEFLGNFIKIDEQLNEDMTAAFSEIEEMKKHPENYKSYESFEEMLEDLDDEV